MPLDKSQVRKGMLLFGGAQPGWIVGHAPPPCEVFKAQQAQAPSLAAIAERIAEAPKRIDALQAAVRAAKQDPMTHVSWHRVTNALPAGEPCPETWTAAAGRFADRHPSPPPTITELPMLVHGIAASTTIAADRQRFAPRCFTWDAQLPPLLFRHDATRVAGKILALAHDHLGRLIITAEITDPVAAACTHFSVGAVVNAYALVDETKPTYYAEIKSATVTEVSMTTAAVAASADCRVTSRWPPSAQAKQYALLQRGVDLQRYYGCCR